VQYLTLLVARVNIQGSRDDVIAHVWKGNTPAEVAAEMADVTSRGLRALLSSCWYLNYINYGEDWDAYYKCDPQDFNGAIHCNLCILQ
jgi:hypothetical protein